MEAPVPQGLQKANKTPADNGHAWKDDYQALLLERLCSSSLLPLFSPALPRVSPVVINIDQLNISRMRIHSSGGLAGAQLAVWICTAIRSLMNADSRSVYFAGIYKEYFLPQMGKLIPRGSSFEMCPLSLTVRLGNVGKTYLFSEAEATCSSYILKRNLT